jgi:hypothetical protein
MIEREVRFDIECQVKEWRRVGISVVWIPEKLIAHTNLHIPNDTNKKH